MNIILSGVPENDSDDDDRLEDKAMCERILTALHIRRESSEVFNKVDRLGRAKHGNSPRLLRLKCCDLSIKQELLRKSRNLKSHLEFKRVYINQHDLTPLQRKRFKELHEEWKRRKSAGEDVVILRDRVTNRPKSKFFETGF